MTDFLLIIRRFNGCLNCFSSFIVNVNESLGSELEHCGNVRFRYCETRIDYMGTCILMGNMSAFRISMSDDWKTNLKKSSSSGKFEPECVLRVQFSYSAQ